MARRTTITENKEEEVIKQLFLGSGKDVRIPPFFETFQKEDITTLDINPDRDPDIVGDLTQFPWPLEDESFEQVYAFETLEHLGQQGDAEMFFKQFEEIWRILKKDGLFIASVPGQKSPWLWGDPSHTRAILPETLIFLDQDNYSQCGPNSPMTDFRYMYKKGNFKLVESKHYYDDMLFVFVLQKKDLV